jgi:glycosyltransferase involved in cell wall biosynthesis
MPVFNRKRFVDEAIQSVLAQDFTDFELLIVDDGSTDGTLEVLRTWTQRDARIVVVTLSVPSIARRRRGSWHERRGGIPKTAAALALTVPHVCKRVPGGG